MKINWLEFLRSNLPNFVGFQEIPLFDHLKSIVGWHSYLDCGDWSSFSGGTHTNRITARRIALAEALERITIKPLVDSPSPDFLFDEFPSSSGCAGGFNRSKARFRAHCEGLERWAWSQWIDKGFYINEISKQAVTLSPLAKSLETNFDQVLYFEKIFGNMELQTSKTDLCIKIVVGIADKGAFPGSRVCLLSEDGWTHALIEAHRHFDMAKQFHLGGNLALRSDDWYLNRVVYFSTHAERALAQINNAKQIGWDEPIKRLSIEIPSICPSHFFLHRTLFNDFIPWNRGPKDRFVF